MKKINRVTCFILLLLFSFPAFAQQNKEFTKEELQKFEDKVKDITSFYFYLLNTLSGNLASSSEKEIIVTESYKKYFRGENVQIEDDLAEHRTVPTNKKVAAYLKDVDFFFKEARFDFEIKEVTQHVNDQGIPYFKVSLNRRLSGISVQGDTLNNTQERFIEINIDKSEELKIASIYTTKLSEKEDLINWWKSLSFGWQKIFKDALGHTKDSLSLEDLKRVTAIKELDLSQNNLINSLEPLSKLNDLERLNIAHSRIDDLSPLRNLTKIKILNATNTHIHDIEALRYAFDLEKLLIDDTSTDTLEVLKNKVKLRQLGIRNTPVNNLTPLNKAKGLLELYAAGTQISSIEPVKNLSALQILDASETNLDSLPEMVQMANLKILDISNTSINDLTAVAELKKLEEIRFENTNVASLEPLSGLGKLKRIYSDDTQISREGAAEFMKQNPGILVLFASDMLFDWWKKLSQEWKKAFDKNGEISEFNAPSKEELAALVKLDSLNLSNFKLNSLEPLKAFHQLDYLNLRNSELENIELLAMFSKIRVLNISGNPISKLNVLSQLRSLETLFLNNLPSISLEPLYGHENLRLIYAKGTPLNDEQVKTFTLVNPHALVVYKTEALTEWWEQLDNEWRDAFAENAGFKGIPNEQMLHKIIFIDVFELRNMNISNVEPLTIMLAPSALYLDKVTVHDITPIHKLTTLKRLNLTGMPLSDICPVKTLVNLEQLLLSDTPVEHLEAIKDLSNLKELNISSTQIDNIKILAFLPQLERLNIANTGVKRLKHITALEKLEELICYNTKVSPREVDKFKAAQPQCRVVYYR